MDVFIIHPIDGSVERGTKVLSHFLNTTKHSIHGIHASNKLIEPCGVTIEGLALEYAKQIEAKQCFPCFISGFCVGGVIALEIARILSKKDIPLAGIGMFDTPNLLSPDKKETVLNYWKTHKKQVKRMEKMSYGINPDIVEKQLTITGNFLMALVEYQPTVFEFNQEVVFFQPEENKLCFDNLDQGDIFNFNPLEKGGWIDLIKSELKIISISGRHRNYCKKPHVRVFARELLNLLNEVS